MIYNWRLSENIELNSRVLPFPDGKPLSLFSIPWVVVGQLVSWYCTIGALKMCWIKHKDHPIHWDLLDEDPGVCRVVSKKAFLP